jgi:hypothetical protein
MYFVDIFQSVFIFVLAFLKPYLKNSKFYVMIFYFLYDFFAYVYIWFLLC